MKISKLSPKGLILVGTGIEIHEVKYSVFVYNMYLSIINLMSLALISSEI